jgi:hypothetical protein
VVEQEAHAARRFQILMHHEPAPQARTGSHSAAPGRTQTYGAQRPVRVGILVTTTEFLV